MYDFSQAEIQITKADILAKIDCFSIWKYYCKNFEDIDKSFVSELYIDKKPSCRIYSDGLELKYKDFGSGEHYDFVYYVVRKYNCTYYEALNIIASDFKLRDKKLNISPNIILSNDVPKLPIVKSKSYIDIVPQGFTKVDFRYWNQYHIPLEMLLEYDIFSCKRVFLYKGEKRWIFNYGASNPIYAYKFTGPNRVSYKIYRPLADKKSKWLFSGGTSEDIEGFDQLPLYGDLLILSKAMKDILCLKLCGYNAISLQGEANRLSQELVNKLLRRFKEIVVFYDNDEQGIKSSKDLQIQYKFRILSIDTSTNCKDFSDYIKKFGLEKGKELIKRLLDV